MSAPGKARVRRAFSRGAPAYDAHAVVQRRAADRLLELALAGLPPPRRVLDVGAGTGTLLARLAARLPGAALAGLDLAHGMAALARDRAPAALTVGDAEALPFRAATFDLVVSTSTLQWIPALARAAAELRRVVTPGGTVAVALFTGQTLHELRDAWRQALPPGAPERTPRFHAAAEVGDALAAAGLEVTVLTSERVVERHPDPLALVWTLKRIGAGTAAGGGARGLGARRALHRMARAYVASHGGPDGVPATWEIAYAVARAPGR